MLLNSCACVLLKETFPPASGSRPPSSASLLPWYLANCGFLPCSVSPGFEQPFLSARSSPLRAWYSLLSIMRSFLWTRWPFSWTECQRRLGGLRERAGQQQEAVAESFNGTALILDMSEARSADDMRREQELLRQYRQES